MRVKTKVWFRALIAASISGAASVITSIMGVFAANGVGISVPSLDLKQLGIMLLSGSLIGTAGYLMKSPLPSSSQTEFFQKSKSSKKVKKK